jgi:hypothetical protein
MKTAVLSSLFLPTLAAAALTGGNEAIDNGSFSAGLTGWSTVGNVTIDSGAMRLSAGGQAYQVFDAPGYPVGAYEFSYDFKTEAPYDSWRLTVGGGNRFKAVMGEEQRYGDGPSFWEMYSAHPVLIEPGVWYHLSVSAESYSAPSTLTLSRISDGAILSSYTGATSAQSPNGGRLQLSDFTSRSNGDLWIDNLSLYQVPEIGSPVAIGLGLLLLLTMRRNRP